MFNLEENKTCLSSEQLPFESETERKVSVNK